MWISKQINIKFMYMQEEKVYGGGAESFGKVWGPGDVVGVFLDLVDHTISKEFTFTSYYCFLFLN
jgi:ryanodine receptor 2